MNRVAAHIAQIQVKIDALTDEQRASLDKSMDIEPFEHFAFQEEQARAHAMQKITPEEAMIIYNALGEVCSSSNGGWTKDTNLATKVTVTKIMGELIGSRMGVRT